MISRSLLAPVALLWLCAGCHKATIEAYRVPKEKDPEMPVASAPAGSANDGGSGMAGTAVPTEQGAELAWSAPVKWKQKPASAMRKGSYTVPGNGGEDGDFSITAFPGDVGGELANVNRWRGQLQLPPITEADLPADVTHGEHNGLQFSVVDFVATGANPHRMLGAMVPFGGATWFFKLSGPDAVVENAKSDFLALLDTVKPAGSPAGPLSPADTQANGAGVVNASASTDNAMASTAVPTAQGEALAWSAPADWAQQPASAMRKGSYRVHASGGEDADLSITAFPGDVGGELANVNRWRGQVGLASIAEGELATNVERQTHDGLTLTIVDVTGPGDGARRILGAIVPFGNATWFFKLSGPSATLAAAKPEFLSFLQTVKPAATSTP